jgi:hypothetical protein
MEAQTLEARFEQIAISDQNEDPSAPKLYHKSKVNTTQSILGIN